MSTALNPNARNFFEKNPRAKYWYYSLAIRVPNPKLAWKPGWSEDPWPSAHEILNQDCDC